MTTKTVINYFMILFNYIYATENNNEIFYE